jgi:hypothetical protein
MEAIQSEDCLHRQGYGQVVDEALGRTAYDDNVNSVKRILTALGRNIEKADEGMYVEAPVVMRSEVRRVIGRHKNALSKHKQWVSK